MQVPGDRADPPFFYMVIAQDLRLQFSGNSHGQILFDVDGFEAPDDEARILGGQRASNYGRSRSTAMPIAADRAPKRFVCSRSVTGPLTPNHRTGGGVNPDTSHFFAACDNGRHGRHA
jgi:hypothetical protein